MKLIQENPYRIVGILSNATAKEIQGRKSKITAYAKVGKQVSSEFDFPFLNNIEKDQNSIEKAFSAIQQSKEMLDNSLFWFSKSNSFDETALNYLINGDKEKAIEIWEKVTFDKEITSKNISCFNNIGTLKLLGTTKTDIKEGIEAKLKLIESNYFEDFAHSVAGEAYVVEKQKQLESFVTAILNQLNGKFTNSETLKLFENCNDQTRKFIADKFTEEPFHKIETAIESTKKKRNQSKIDAYKFGTKLYNDTKINLEELKSMLGANDLRYKLIADNLAKEIMQCGIDYFNQSQEEDSIEDYLENAMRLNKLADSIAVGKLTKDKAKDHIATLEEMKDRELSQAIEVLTFVRDAFEKNKAEITAQVRKQELTLGYGQTINWTKVNEMINNSLDWDKVLQLITESIPLKNIEKIKNTRNSDRLSEYKKLVEFLQSKLSYSNKNKIKYLNFWQTSTSTSTSTSRPTTTTTTSQHNEEGIPDWLKWVGGIILFIILIRACN